MKTFALLSLTILITFCSAASAAERPNIILIMVDDMGFSDLGYHGSEIATPNIDALAQGGVRFSQFYNNGRCCPTRATLMTGLYPHQSGIGHMTESPGELNYGAGKSPAYQGFLNHNCVTIAEALQGAGYATLMSGKWHLGENEESRWPLQRGYDKYFGCLSGATLHFYPGGDRGMSLGNEAIETPESTTDEQFYTTDAFTDYAIRFLKEEQAGDKRPMFLYLAYTAPHWPIQAFEDDIAKYRGKYKIGWDKLRQQRLAKQKELGLVSADLELSPRTPNIPAWETLDAEKQDEMDLKMAIYAAMIDRIDQNIGKLMKYLKESGIEDDTMILFLSDNGGCQEGGVLGGANFRDIEKRNHEYFHGYGEAWANASNTPFRLYKHFNHEGGTATPFFIHWSAKITSQTDWYAEPAQLIDVMPTILDVAGATYPTEYEGNRIHPLDGISLRPALEGKSLDRQKPICIEHENNASIRSGDWKLVGRNVARPRGVHPENWELYNITADRTETNNLAAENPEKVRELAKQWNAWSKRVLVYPKLADDAPAKKPTAKAN
ncbi:arylsulfatase [Blastopirellula sp. JC732]|uniref:Arylsulfatase n=1 Tax=Blastopirellula sediminis TaxID=2894196 RepID=A0A9X1MPS5_9BACT|nr:arylsulfatase [Blastopirellula sediminis]MCC9606908.1 arylsulfatase [Blastopirellula sediminis]MCC9629797.1 arylsulfatase [Blastopirellula sediminis]